MIGLPIAEAKSKFIKPARLGDALEITSYVTEWKRKTFEMVHAVRIDGELCVEGMEMRVCAKKTEDGGIRAITIPDEIKQRLSNIN